MESKQLAIVHWEDPTTHTGWISKTKASKKKAAGVVSIGHIVFEDEDYIRIGMDAAFDGDYNGVGVIPKRCVISVYRIDIPPVILIDLITEQGEDIDE